MIKIKILVSHHKDMKLSQCHYSMLVDNSLKTNVVDIVRLDYRISSYSDRRRSGGEGDCRPATHQEAGRLCTEWRVTQFRGSQ